jgi:hypothetical protein
MCVWEGGDLLVTHSTLLMTRVWRGGLGVTADSQDPATRTTQAMNMIQTITSFIPHIISGFDVGFRVKSGIIGHSSFVCVQRYRRRGRRLRVAFIIVVKKCKAIPVRGRESP